MPNTALQNQYSSLLKDILLQCNETLRKNESIAPCELIPSEDINSLSVNDFLTKNHRVLVRNILRELLDKVYMYIKNSPEVSPITKVKAPMKGGAEYQEVARLRQYLPFGLEEQKTIFLLANRTIIHYANKI